ncbi:outer membrane beta-barrel protein [Chitinophaga tropicalis]|uniref:TonB-dependent receptor n=1 Tax=Chitinophaga tropicalis TaxID=2683588 RepID=A0A7K1U2V2_9BACT|nr:outer membrane beta-barrel protein [Chitinophaga tropicalis]MVT08697.1 TonB-dependent receptor [Chitinophaga tropicalis]
MKQLILIVLLAIASYSTSFAQQINGKVTIKITETNGQPLPFTNVLLRQVKDSSLVKGELSTVDGTTTFEKIEAGKYFIQASLMGYATVNTASFSIDASHRQLNLPAIALHPSTQTLQGVTVSAQKPFIERKDGATVLNVESSLAASGGSALDVLKRAPGVQIDKDDNIILKGNQGVTVMLDGKLTYLSGEQLANLLKSLPAESISQIEIITSPSAKYDAAGKSGIINIKTKKGVITGINGSLNAGGGFGRYGFYNAGGNLNWRTQRFNLFGTYNYANRKFFNSRLLTRNIEGDEPQFFSSSVYGNRNFINNSYKAGMDYFITQKHTVGVLVNGYRNSFYANNWNRTDISSGRYPHRVLDSILNTFSTSNNRFNNTTVNLNYKGQLDTVGTELSVDADYADFKYQRRIHLRDSMYYVDHQQNVNPHAIRNFTVTAFTIKSIKADLVLPVNKTTKIEAGFKGSFVKTDNDLSYDSLQNGHYEHAVTQSNRFIYTEDVLAAYGIIKKNFKKTDMQLGLRMEHTSSDGYSVTLQSHVKRNYLNLFPSLSVDHTFSETHKLGLSYSKRITRPSYDDLNPFVYYLDKYTYFRGNPYLNPEYIHKGEITYTLKQKYILAAAYTLTKDVMLEYLDQNDETKVTTSYDKNFKRSYGYNVSMTVPLDPFKWWNITNNVNLNYNKFDVQDSMVNTGTSALGVSYQSTHTFTLPDNWKLELNGYYDSPFSWGIFKFKSSYAVGFGAQKSLFSKKVTVKLNVTDFTNGEQFRGVARYNNLDMNIHNRWQNRRANLAVTWNFGNSAVKAARERQTGTSDEERRTGS